MPGWGVNQFRREPTPWLDPLPRPFLNRPAWDMENDDRVPLHWAADLWWPMALAEAVEELIHPATVELHSSERGFRCRLVLSDRTEQEVPSLDREPVSDGVRGTEQEWRAGMRRRLGRVLHRLVVDLLERAVVVGVWPHAVRGDGSFHHSAVCAAP